MDYTLYKLVFTIEGEQFTVFRNKNNRMAIFRRGSNGIIMYDDEIRNFRDMYDGFNIDELTEVNYYLPLYEKALEEFEKYLVLL